MTAEDGSERCCWICLGDQSCGELAHTCNCPPDRVVHRKCLARWQLQSAGKTEETRCRFCNAVYPSWKESLTPKNLKPAIPVVSVHYNGVTYRLKVRPGPEGLASFQKQLQCITGLSELECMQITFQCRAPETSEELNFKGISAFDAAIHCAAISASEREREQAAAAAAAAATAAAASAAASSSAAPCVRDEGDQRWATPSSTRSRAGSDAASSSSSRRRLSVPDEIVAAPLGRDSSASDGGYNRQQSAPHAEGAAPAPHQPQLSRYAGPRRRPPCQPSASHRQPPPCTPPRTRRRAPHARLRAPPRRT